MELEVVKQIELPLDWGKWVTGHCGGVGSPPPNQRKRLHTVEARDVVALTILASFAHIDQNDNDGSKPAPTGTLWGNCSVQVALRREQQEWLELNLHENRALGKEG
jgi:hypothetical protein